MRQMAIVGGGLTGLAAAYYFGKTHPDWKVELFESENRFGGKVKTKRVDGYVVEIGPDSYLARKTAMTDFITELGLGETIVENATGQAYIYDRGTMNPIPGGSIVGIPTEIIPFAISPLLSVKGKLRAATDWFKKPYETTDDVSIGDFFRYHLGQEMMDKLIEPLLSGIYGGDIYKLSLDATFPDFHHLEKKYGNMLKGTLAMRRQRAKGPVKAAAQFRQVTGGLESIIDAAVAQMPSNVTLHLGRAVISLERYTAGDGYRLVYRQGAESEKEQVFDEVILTTPPQAYRRWFLGDPAFDCLRQMDLSSCAIAILGFEKKNFDASIAGTGFLITRKTETPLTACTYMSVKWPQTTPEDKVVLRVFLGKAGDSTVSNCNEQELGRIALAEAKKMIGFSCDPLWSEVARLDKSMPQYSVGHRGRIATLRAHVAAVYPGLHVIGTPFDGVGMPDGIKQAKELVDAMTEK